MANREKIGQGSMKSSDSERTAFEARFLPPFSVIIPAYNESEAIGGELAKIFSLTGLLKTKSEVLVVDDGSEDDTPNVVSRFEAVTLVRHKGNRGYGAALKTGIRHAKYDLICISDADGTYPKDQIPNLIRHLTNGHYDMVVGARVGQNVAIPLVRQPAKWALGKLANLASGEKIPDVNSGLRAFRRPAVLSFLTILPDGFSFATTITLAMLTNGYRVDHTPIDYYQRIGRSKIRPIKDTLSFTLLILRIALYFAPLKIFISLSGLLLLLALLWGLFSLFWLGRLADVGTLIIVMTAIQVGVIGLLGELINRRISTNYQDGKSDEQ